MAGGGRDKVSPVGGRWKPTVLGGAIDIAGVGVASTTVGGTGLTVLVLPPGATGGVDVRGGAPASRELALLTPHNMVPGPDAVLLTGGSAFGLSAADGVMWALFDAGRGFPAGETRVPIVPALAVFDVNGDRPMPPTAAHARDAAERALRGGTTVQEGRCGAGAGTTVAKHVPGPPVWGGQAAVTHVVNGVRVAALMVVNAVGSVMEADGKPVVPLPDVCDADGWAGLEPLGQATTIGVVVVDGSLDKAGLTRVAIMAHDGLARAIVPAHTPWDGDAIIAAAVGGPTVSSGEAGAVAADAVAGAVRRAVRISNGLLPPNGQRAPNPSR